jgi:hypothetical protein
MAALGATFSRFPMLRPFFAAVIERNGAHTSELQCVGRSGGGGEVLRRSIEQQVLAPSQQRLLLRMHMSIYVYLQLTGIPESPSSQHTQPSRAPLFDAVTGVSSSTTPISACTAPASHSAAAAAGYDANSHAVPVRKASRAVAIEFVATPQAVAGSCQRAIAATSPGAMDGSSGCRGHVDAHVDGERIVG